MKFGGEGPGLSQLFGQTITVRWLSNQTEQNRLRRKIPAYGPGPGVSLLFGIKDMQFYYADMTISRGGDL